MRELLIQAQDLNTYYGASHILRGVNFSVGRGETIGLMGRNGMGKSTLLKSIMGLVKPSAGSVAIKGQNMTGAATYAVARHLGTSLAMMAPKAITDGKAGFTRFSDGPYKSVLLQVEKQYESARNALAGALSTLNSTVASDIPLVFFGVASPATDPVVE
jgi:ABC-type oligopeptide transport system ATPase subunit